MKRTSFGTARCPVARALDAIGDWWTLLIVREALRGARRFGEFEQRLGLAKNILAARLRKMVADGILERRPAPERADRSEYHLTEKGRRLQVVLLSLRQWGEDHLYAPGEEITLMVDEEAGAPLRRLRVQAEDGRLLGPGEVRLRSGRTATPDGN
ncbi:winged helix-turn-helix transcriptional regulator [Marinibaculum pumilum]|uniref:Winged helix-turn-helix transcriptional regulator n=1 Tax=Marinibaculum pumilum TaxID=1766165 RepID=A0ABV7L9J0_9PROT